MLGNYFHLFINADLTKLREEVCGCVCCWNRWAENSFCNSYTILLPMKLNSLPDMPQKIIFKLLACECLQVLFQEFLTLPKQSHTHALRFHIFISIVTGDSSNAEECHEIPWSWWNRGHEGSRSIIVYFSDQPNAFLKLKAVEMFIDQENS